MFDGWVLVVGVDVLDVRFVMYRTEEQAELVAEGLRAAGCEVVVQGFQFVPEALRLVE